ncbi:MAG TPA: phosphoglycerate dehydrogenase [Candidatus Saccharimonadales bacterium]|nr:phosphoglycerate dehydrogenase [Candidatus Saccharimonadales bacterium]
MLTNFIIDFDSTLVTIETLDELAKIALAEDQNKERIIKQINEITKNGMDGKIDFPTSLEKRIALFKPNRNDIKQLIQILNDSITTSVIRNKEFFKNNKNNIYIITGGFIEYVLPIISELGIDKSHVLANSFMFDNKGQVIGYDKKNPLANIGGKTKAVENLKLKGDIIVIGDGYTDYEIKKNGAAKKFFAFTENINRPSVAELADDVMFNFDELLFLYDSDQKTIEQETGPLALILGQPHEKIISQFEQEGFRVVVEDKVLTKYALSKLIKEATVLIVDSLTQINTDILDGADKLLAIGRFGQTTTKINQAACTKKGIAVFNAPFTNIRSVAELAIGEIIMLSRNVIKKNTQLKKGIWDRAHSQSHEIKGKKLGIIGYGAVGTQLSLLAESLGMQVYFYDKKERATLGNATKCDSLEALLRISDVVSLHADASQINDYPLTLREFLLMKQGVLFINLSPGYVIPEKLLAQQLKNKKLAGLATDVFSKEPKNTKDKFTSPLQKFENVILTPHIGSNTSEAMEASGNFVVQKILNFVGNGTTIGCINLPELSLPDNPHTNRFLHIHKNIQGVLADINRIMRENQANIEGQYLKTNEEIGYVITDVTTQKAAVIMKELEKIPGTIRVREIF